MLMATPFTLLVLCGTATLLQSCTDEAKGGSVRDDETRWVARQCGLYKDAVAKSFAISRAVGHPVMIVDRNAFPKGSPHWRCLEGRAEKIGYELTYTWVMT